MQSYIAEIGEIVRAQRRDEEELEEIQERLSFIIKELAGQRTWARVYPFLSSIAKAAYYSVTLLAGRQTLGEEYLRLFESNGIERVAPSLPARFVFVLLHVLAPLVAQLGLQKAERRLNHQSTNSFLGISLRNNQKARSSFITLVNWIRTTGIPQLHRVHLSLFYIFGAYYNLSRRVAGIRFISLSPQTDIPALKVYKILGYLSLAQIAVSLILWTVSFVEEEREREKRRKESKLVEDTTSIVTESVRHPWFRCAICLESHNPSAAPCGHLFCWDCIQEHSIGAESEARCPQCRSVFSPQHIVPLLNL